MEEANVGQWNKAFQDVVIIICWVLALCLPVRILLSMFFSASFICSSICPGIFMSVATCLVWRRSRSRPTVTLCEKDLHISVLKPMCGLDPRLRENLESFANLSVPVEFRIFMCFANESEAAVPIAAEYAKTHPERFQLVIGCEPDLANMKMSQLLYGMQKEAETSCNPYIWVSESNVETSQEFMENLAKTWKQANSAGRKPTLVHAPLVGVWGTGLGARMERMHLSSQLNPLHELGQKLMNKFAVVGKTSFFHRDDPEKIGGLRRFGNFLGEDHLLAEAFITYGQLISCNMATRNVLGDMSVWAFFDRHSRWAVMRSRLQTGPFVGEFALGLQWPVLFFLVGAIPSHGIVVWMIIRCIIDFVNYAMLVPREELHPTDMLVGPLKELLLAMAWCRAVLSSQVNWRGGQKLHVGKHSYLKGELT